MRGLLKNDRVRRALLCGAVLLAVVSQGVAARAFHRYPPGPYGPAYGGPVYYAPTYVGPSSFNNPVGTGFGGYSYGGYPNYGYWGYLPGVYAGYGGVAPAPGFDTCPYTVPLMPAAAAPCAPAYPVVVPVAAPAPCEPLCMTRGAYRRYMRRMCRAMAQCGYPGMPPAVSGYYGAMLGAEALAADETIGEIDADYAAIDVDDAEVVGPQMYSAGEPIAPPVEDEAPQLLLERSL